MEAVRIEYKLALKCCGVFSAYSEQKQCVNGCVLTPKRQATQTVIAKFGGWGGGYETSYLTFWGV